MTEVESITDRLGPGKPDTGAQFEGLVFATLLLDPKGAISKINYAAQMLLGRSEKRLLRKAFVQEVDLVDSRVHDHLLHGDGPLVARDIGLKVDGQEYRVNLTVSPVPNHSGWRVITLSDSGRNDNGDLKRGEATSFGAPSILAHEIRNPLAAIRGAAQLAARKLEPKDKGLAKVITDEVDRIARLIDRMQQLGKASPDHLEATNLHEAIRSALATLRAAGLEGVELEEEFDPSLPPVLANRDGLEQVIINLVSNALDALKLSMTRNGQITVRTRFVSGLAFSAFRNGKNVKLPIEVTVTDNGPGIDGALREHIFEPFVTSKKSGQGLGLALVRKIVRDMNGRISHDRDMRRGYTHFKIHLSLAEEGEIN